MNAPALTPSPWAALRRHTPARIALGRAGVAVPTAPMLEFQFAHARARDAVHRELDVEALRCALAARGHQTHAVASMAGDRHIYLRRPDQGRRLDAMSRQTLAACGAAQRSPAGRDDVAFVIADGLSAEAIEANAVALLDALLPSLVDGGWRVAPIVIARQARVAIGDEIGECFGVRIVAVLIGERPGLSSPDSMGIYLTWAPRVGVTDAQRNCISNVRAAGLSHEKAARTLHWLMGEARRRALTGVMLKDEAESTRRVEAGSGHFVLTGHAG